MKSKKNQPAKTSAKGRSGRPIKELYAPVASSLCQDVFHEKNDLVTLVRLLDQIATPVLPVRAAVWFVADLICNDSISVDEYNSSGAQFQMKLTNPQGESFDLMEIESQVYPEGKLLNLQRLIFNFTGGISFKHEGKYTFELYGKTYGHDMEFLTSRWFRIVKIESPSDAEQ